MRGGGEEENTAQDRERARHRVLHCCTTRGMAAMPDVIVPVLNEAAALPSVLAGMPPGYRAIVVDNGSTDGSGDVAAALRCHRDLRTGARLRRCLLGRTAGRRSSRRRRVFHGRRRFSRSRRPADGGRTGAGRRGGSGPGRPAGHRPRRVAGARPVGQRRRSRPNSGAGPVVSCGISVRCGRPGVRTSSSWVSSTGGFGWPLEMVLRAAEAGWRIAEVASPVFTPDRQVQGHRHGAGHGSGRMGHGPGAGMSRLRA